MDDLSIGQLPLESLESCCNHDPKTVYTDALLRELLASWPREICDCHGCMEPIYKGRAENPYHCCARHRNAIKMSQWHQQQVAINILDQYDLKEESVLIQKASPIRPGRYKRSKQRLCLTCDYCGKSFLRLKSEVEKERRRGRIYFYCSHQCADTHHRKSEPVQLTCARCGTKFVRPWWQVNKAKQLNCKRAFCQSCSQNPYVIVTCFRCNKTFQRLWSLSKNNKIGQLRTRVFCPDCKKERRASVTLKCDCCGKEFRRKRYMHDAEVKKGKKFFFCCQSHNKWRLLEKNLREAKHENQS